METKLNMEIKERKTDRPPILTTLCLHGRKLFFFLPLTLGLTLYCSASPPLAPHPVLEGDGDEDPTSIMLVSSQDPEMAKFYLGLPKIDSFADVTPFGTDALDGLETVRASVVATGKKMLASDFK